MERSPRDRPAVEGTSVEDVSTDDTQVEVEDASIDANPVETGDVPAPPGGVSRIGTDVVSIDRIEAVLAERGEAFERRVFRPTEREYCSASANPPEHYAARWAAKEAFIKTLAGRSVPMDAVGVEHRGERPVLALTDRARMALEASVADGGVDPGTATVDTSVSLSHDRDSGTALASVLVVAFP